MRAKQRVMNKRTTISLKGKLGHKALCKCSTKKYPLYRLATISLELLDRKPYEMHPSCSSFAVKVAAFLVTFFAAEKSDWHVGPLPTTLNLKLQRNHKNPEYNNTITQSFKIRLRLSFRS